MPAALDPQTGVAFESLMFRDNLIEVSFTEEHDRGNGVARVQTIVVDATRVPQEHMELLEALTTFVDASLLLLRNPPSSFQRST